jgi:fatty-acyl-CoA synthase
LKPGAKVAPGELEDWIRERTPERAAVPAQIIVIDPMPLTAVGKVFKPHLRWDAAQRVFAQRLTALREQGLFYEISVGPHDTHGTLAIVTVKDVPSGSRDAVAQQVHEVLNPFVIRHEIRWT